MNSTSGSSPGTTRTQVVKEHNQPAPGARNVDSGEEPKAPTPLGSGDCPLIPSAYPVDYLGRSKKTGLTPGAVAIPAPARIATRSVAGVGSGGDCALDCQGPISSCESFGQLRDPELTDPAVAGPLPTGRHRRRVSQQNQMCSDSVDTFRHYDAASSRT